MSIIDQKTRLISSLLPQGLVSKIEGKREEKLFEQGIDAIAMFIINALSETIKYFQKGDLKKFDGNPGNSTCQCLALELRRIQSRELLTESTHLGNIIAKIKKAYHGEKRTLPSDTLFQMHFAEIYISKEMEFLLHAYVSAVLRTPYETKPNGVVMTMSSISKLETLSKNINKLGNYERRKILENNQTILSQLSIEAIRRHALARFNPDQLAVKMLSEEHVHLFSANPDYDKKAFGFQFYQIKSFLNCVRHDQEVICLKSIVPKGDQIFYLFFKSQQVGGEFEPIDQAQLDTLTHCMVFEAVFNFSKEKVSEEISKHGFAEIALVQASFLSIYEPGTTIDVLENGEARAEILAYREKKNVVGEPFTVDHIYLNTLKMEFQGVRK